MGDLEKNTWEAELARSGEADLEKKNIVKADTQTLYGFVFYFDFFSISALYCLSFASKILTRLTRFENGEFNEFDRVMTEFDRVCVEDEFISELTRSLKL